MNKNIIKIIGVGAIVLSILCVFSTTIEAQSTQPTSQPTSQPTTRPFDPNRAQTRENMPRKWDENIRG
jgi:hypothetical protein